MCFLRGLELSGITEEDKMADKMADAERQEVIDLVGERRLKKLAVVSWPAEYDNNGDEMMMMMMMMMCVCVCVRDCVAVCVCVCVSVCDGDLSV